MTSVLYNLIPVVLAAIAVVLVLGLVNLARGGDPRRSQKLMRARIALQAVALAIVAAAAYLINV